MDGGKDAADGLVDLLRPLLGLLLVQHVLDVLQDDRELLPAELGLLLELGDVALLLLHQSQLLLARLLNAHLDEIVPGVVPLPLI